VRPHLEEQVGATLRPLHLLLLHKAFADHLIHGRLGHGRRDGFPVAVPVPIIGNEGFVGRDVALKLPESLEEFPLFRTLLDGLQVHLQIFDLPERLVDIAMPQRPFEAVQLVLDIDVACGLSRR
jgi:hypothetical protein